MIKQLSFILAFVISPHLLGSGLSYAPSEESRFEKLYHETKSDYVELMTNSHPTFRLEHHENVVRLSCNQNRVLELLVIEHLMREGTGISNLSEFVLDILSQNFNTTIDTYFTLHQKKNRTPLERFYDLKVMTTNWEEISGTEISADSSSETVTGEAPPTMLEPLEFHPPFQSNLIALASMEAPVYEPQESTTSHIASRILPTMIPLAKMASIGLMVGSGYLSEDSLLGSLVIAQTSLQGVCFLADLYGIHNLNDKYASIYECGIMMVLNSGNLCLSMLNLALEGKNDPFFLAGGILSTVTSFGSIPYWGLRGLFPKVSNRVNPDSNTSPA